MTHPPSKRACLSITRAKLVCASKVSFSTCNFIVTSFFNKKCSLLPHRCPSLRTHDANWKRHRSHALYEQSHEGLWKATKLRSKVVECSWCSDCGPDACRGNLLQRGPQIAQPPIEVAITNPGIHLYVSTFLIFVFKCTHNWSSCFVLSRI